MKILFYESWDIFYVKKCLQVCQTYLSHRPPSGVRSYTTLMMIARHWPSTFNFRWPTPLQSYNLELPDDVWDVTSISHEVNRTRSRRQEGQTHWVLLFCNIIWGAFCLDLIAENRGIRERVRWNLTGYVALNGTHHDTYHIFMYFQFYLLSTATCHLSGKMTALDMCSDRL